MRAVIGIVVWVLSFIGLYLILSLCGLVFSNMSYKAILREGGWIITYFLFIGWWIATIVMMKVDEDIYGDKDF